MNKNVSGKSHKCINPLEGTNGQLMITAAVRYCLGRESYIVGSCQEWVLLYWPFFVSNTRCVLVRDILEALIDNEAGSVFDWVGWNKLAGDLWKLLTVEEQIWVKQALAHKIKLGNFNELHGRYSSVLLLTES